MKAGQMKIGFNKPYLTGKEFSLLSDVVRGKHLSGNGPFTKLCQEFLQNRYGFGKCLLTTSCTDALEMAAILLNVVPGDEIIMPSYTFVSTANAFVLFGARIVFVDSCTDNPNLDVGRIAQLITSKTKAIVVVHYAGISCDMEAVEELASEHGLFIIEDAAQAIDSYHIGKNGVKRALGSIGHLAAFSFHETKNIIAGEGGMLVVNDRQFEKRAEIIWEKGTDRCAFFRGEVDKYSWVDIGSSFLPSEIIAAILWAQLESIEDIQAVRTAHWKAYYENLFVWASEKEIMVPRIPEFATNNAHMFYLVCKEPSQRVELIDALRDNHIVAIFHYLSLHKSKYYINKHDGRELPFADHYSDCLVRLPMYYELTETEIGAVCDVITDRGTL